MIIFGVPFAPLISGGEVLSNDDAKAHPDVAKNTWSGDAGVNFVNAYYAYGILQEDKGLIAEPFLDVFYTFESESFINKATIGVQLWSSIHSKETGATTRKAWIAPWYEQDVDIPVSVTFSEPITLTLSYLDYHFPQMEHSTLKGLSV